VENSGTQNYLQYVSAEQSRLNVIYVGANDGFLHGFRAGSVDGSGNLIANSTTPNDGQEVLAYMLGSTLYSLANATVPATAPPNCTDHSHTQTVVQNIHGVTPVIGANPLCVDTSLDTSNPQYGHNFFVDATPGTGDLFYGGVWHTWLVGGLGIGGAAIYALDITNPANFTEGNASSLVVGEWNASTLSCSTSCAGNLGNTFGIPQIRRLHNGKWAAIFGNGFGSVTGDAGIYVMSIDVNSSGAPVETFYYLSTHTGTGTASAPCSSNCNGIAYVTAADLDGDHVTDYVYAGDLKGNVWRFDLTSTSPASWAAASAPLFTTPSGQPITTQLLVLSSTGGGAQRLMVEFATGQRTQVTNTTAVSYASGTQAIYGIWDWNMSGWNAMSSMKYANLAAAATGLTAPYTIPSTGTPITSLAQQVFTINANLVSVDGTNVAVCWQGGTACTTNNQFGWYANLPGVSEQVIFNPVYFQGAILVDSTVPVVNTPTSCTQASDTGFTYAISVANGGIFTNAFPGYTKNGTLVNDPIAAGVQTNATGSVYVVKTKEGTTNLIYQTVDDKHGHNLVNIPANTKSKRLTWVERR
jgi:type IV pilus assembly protein PilY1